MPSRDNRLPHSKDAVGPRHEPALDGIRGLAILLVLLSHAVDFLGPVRHQPGDPRWGIVLGRIFIPGWGGVDLFFALSGFLITGILLRARGRPNYFTSFYARRALRIFPAYYGMLILLLLLSTHSHLVQAALPAGSTQRLSYFFYVANWPVFWSSWNGMGGLLGIYWSLNVEEQFYLVWPALIRFAKPELVWTLCIFGFITGWLERSVLIHQHGLMFGLMQWPFSRLDGLFLGAALALYSHIRGKPLPLAGAGALFAAGAAMYAWIAIAHTSDLGGSGVALWRFGVTAFALMSAGLLGAAQHPATFAHRLLCWQPLRIAGKYSYGIYIYHLLIYRYLGLFYEAFLRHRFGDSFVMAAFYIPFAILVTFGVAAFSFRFFETPFLRLKRRFPAPAAV